MKVYTWQDIYNRLEEAPKARLYGVPRGGAIIAGLTGRAVDSPEAADWIVDDIVDTGATQKRYVEKYDKPFWALIRKSKSDGWVSLPWEHPDPTKDIADTVIRQLEFIGEDPNREGLRETPGRVLRALQELTRGYQQNPSEILGTVFDEPYDEMVLVRGIDFSSLCEHHMLPFIGTATVAYIPKDRVVGLSKIARLVQCFAARLQIQERLTRQIAQAIEGTLSPLGVAVTLKASHSCMSLRGIKSKGELITSCLLGYFKDRPDTRNEFLGL